MAHDTSTAHSIWLRFDRAAEDELSRFISKFANVRNSPTFVPHTTLLGDIHAMPASTLAACETGFAGKPPLVAKVSGVARTDAFFMSLFLDLEVPEALYAIRDTIGQHMGLVTAGNFRPHISLAYGEDGKDVSDTAIRAVEDVYVGRSLVFKFATIVASAQTIPIVKWQSLYDLELPVSRKG